MKIAFIGQKGLPVKSGGVERHVEDLAVKMVEMGHEVLAYTRWNYSDRRCHEYRGIKLVGLPSLGTKHLDAISHTLLACLDLLRRKVDVIHFHSIGPSSLIWFARIMKPYTPIVATFHSRCYHHHKWGKAARLYLRLSEALCCLFADKVIAISKSLSNYASYRYNIKPFFIPNGVIPPQTVPDAKEIEERWGLTRGSYIVSIGRLIPHKGIHYLIEAFRQIETDKKLVIVGDGFFTDTYVNDLHQLAKGDERIIFTGAQSGQTVQALYAHAFTFVQPSESEGLSIALLEAMSHSRAVVVSDIPENMEAVQDTGITFVNRSTTDLKNRLEALLRNPEIAQELGALARQRVEEFYDWGAIAKEVEKVYVYSRKLYRRHLLKLLYYRLRGSHLFGREEV